MLRRARRRLILAQHLPLQAAATAMAPATECIHAASVIACRFSVPQRKDAGKHLLPGNLWTYCARGSLGTFPKLHFYFRPIERCLALRANGTAVAGRFPRRSARCNARPLWRSSFLASQLPTPRPRKVRQAVEARLAELSPSALRHRRCLLRQHSRRHRRL